MYSAGSYWSRLARDRGTGDADCLATVLHPGAPHWFNRAVASIQTRAWRLAIRRCTPGVNRALDVGCGAGRWLDQLDQTGVHAIGIDLAFELLRLARRRGTTAPLITAEAQRLPFPGETFDLVSSVTVVQHIPFTEQDAALKEMVRVLKPGGYLVLLEATRGVGSHMFPHHAGDWIRSVRALNCELSGWSGCEFLLLDRTLLSLVSMLRYNIDHLLGAPSSSGLHDSEWRRKLRTVAKRAYWALRRLSVGLSMLIEPLVERVCRGVWATHASFVFRKRALSA